MKKLRKIKIIFAASIAVAVLAAGTLGYFIGNRQLLRLVKGESSVSDLQNTDFQLFWDAYLKLKSAYNGDIDPQKYLYGAIEGGYGSLNDPYTVFLSPELSKDFTDELSGELEGIGVKIGELDGAPAIIAPLEDSPAQKAGLKPKDKIVKIDDVDTQTMSLDEVVSKIRGTAGTTVKLDIQREGVADLLHFEIKREKIEVKTVEVSYIDDVAIVALNEFGLDTKVEFSRAAQEIAGKNINKLILDLRNNPGGLLDGAIDVSGEIFPEGTTVVLEQNKTSKDELKTTSSGTLKQVKLAVLVNGGTASSAEIVAGAIKDHNRGKVIGEKTFGKGTVQELDPLRGGSSAKITVAKWLTPKGTNIDKNGIVPDIEVKEPDNILFLSNDPLVKRAIEELDTTLKF